MGKYLLFFSYLGNRYRGLQKQVHNCHIRDVDCVQGAIESAFYTLKPKIIHPPAFTPSSRTDTGVHALHNAAHIVLKNKSGLLYQPTSIVKCLNRHLLRCKHDIKILDCFPMTDSFHARVFAKSRTYIYRLMVAKKDGLIQTPISELNRSSLIRYETFNIEKMKESTKLFIGLRDFRTFAAINKTNREIQYRRILDEFSVEEGSPLFPLDPLSDNFHFFNIKCKGRSFVHNQVRRLVGTICALGGDRVTEKEVITMLQVPSHKNWNPKILLMPPNGLYLAKVEYDPEILKKYTIIYNEKEFLPPMKFDNKR